MVVSVPLALDSETVNWPSSPGSAAVGSLATKVTSAESSSVMVTESAAEAPINSAEAPAVIESRVIVNVSVSSTMLSFRTLMSIKAVVVPAAIVTLPGKLVKSVPSVAVPVTT